MQEEWKPINGYEGLYEISNLGKVKSLARSYLINFKNIVNKQTRILKYGIDGHGYCHVVLANNGKKKTMKIHLLVFDHFGKGKRNGLILQVDHIDNCKINNRIDNLQLLTGRQNILKGFICKRTSKYIGVCFNKNRNKWIAFIKEDGKTKQIGSFKSEYDAHLAYQKEFKKHEYFI